MKWAEELPQPRSASLLWPSPSCDLGADYDAVILNDPAPVPLHVTYNANGATSGSVPTDSTGYGRGDSVTVLGNSGSLVKTGYTFAGWSPTSS